MRSHLRLMMLILFFVPLLFSQESDVLLKERVSDLEESLQASRSRIEQLDALNTVNEYLIIKITVKGKLTEAQSEVVTKQFPALYKSIKSGEAFSFKDIDTKIRNRIKKIEEMKLAPAAKVH